MSVKVTLEQHESMYSDGLRHQNFRYFGRVPGNGEVRSVGGPGQTERNPPRKMRQHMFRKTSFSSLIVNHNSHKSLKTVIGYYSLDKLVEYMWMCTLRRYTQTHMYSHTYRHTLLDICIHTYTHMCRYYILFSK